VHYQQGVNEKLFDRQSTLGADIEVPRQLKPALVRGDKVLLNGVVMLPD